MGYHRICVLTAMAVVAVLMGTTNVAEGQQTPACASKLVPCANYINSTNPPASCCDPLRQALEHEGDCLCTLYNTPGLLKTFGINVTDALLLPQHCKIPGNVNICSNNSAPSPTSVPAPPGVPGKDENGGVSNAWTGAWSLVVIWASVMLY
ncbi:non-specific lipid transfer protein GPI-anchored 7 [Malania oleifera]|uniref:non-specific lipid transfer protein GPI-anchored 7 n=1 Tax=Malania oleifera TaxID=397392 RepID=UPI0025AEC92C|nr:non-specific lipid transfer protein GPI-anchored 7 [Malania oleifera]